MSRRILVVDDEAGIRDSLSLGLMREGYEVSTAGDAESAVKVAMEFRPDLALVDVRLPTHDGLWVLRKFHEEAIPVVMISGNATLQEAVRAVKEGAFDFLEKPLSIDKVIVTAARVLDYERIKDRVSVLSEKTAPDAPIGRAPAWLAAMETASRVAPTDAAVLILGESGTGKERVAEWIHAKSTRASGPFVAVNVAALPETLAESELFGHEKGAFTGAASPKKGRFELASGGTLFLDEIGEMPMEIQPKILRAIESGDIQRLGSERIRKADVRIIAATHRDLKSHIAAGKFREDLFFRLNVIPILLPPLRQRGDDIEQMMDYFLGHFCKRYGRAKLAWDLPARELLHRARWPGNVRELKNLCERLAILCEGTVTESVLESMLVYGPPSASSAEQPSGDLRAKMDAFESTILRETIAACHGSLTSAAAKLGISRSQLYRKLERLGIKTDG